MTAGAAARALLAIGPPLAIGPLLAVPAAAATCAGPAECCPPSLAVTLPQRAEVALGVAVVGLYNVNERSSSWDADYYLYEAWKPQDGFTPQTEIVNEVSRLSEQFDNLVYTDGRCIRSRRIRSTLHTPLNLRLFPFDSQKLVLQVSDSWFDADMAGYAGEALVQGVDESVREQLSQWRVQGALHYQREVRPFHWERGLWGDETPSYDYADFSVSVKRHVTYHLTKFFLPLFVIVLIALSVFWVDPEDLPSQVGIGVTCLLAAIAFQLAQANTLPEISYLTFADLVYAMCYLVIALAMAESIYSNAVCRGGRRARALRLDRICRWAFPTALAAAIALVILVTRLQSA